MASSHSTSSGYPSSVESVFQQGLKPVAEGSQDTVLAKVKSDGSQLLWATHIGGSGHEDGAPSVRVDTSGNPIILTVSDSFDAFTTLNAFDRTINGSTDFYLVKFRADGTGIIFATFIGGSDWEGIETHNLAIDSQNNLVIGASSASANFPTTVGAYDRSFNGKGGGGSDNTNYSSEGVIAKISSDGSTLLASTFLGGRYGEAVEGIAVDASGAIYAAGATFSDNFPVAGSPSQTSFSGGPDAFFTKLTSDLSSLIYSSYFGGSSWDTFRSAAVSPDGNFAGGGETSSSGIFIKNAFQQFFGGASSDGLLVKFSLSQNTQAPTATPTATATATGQNPTATPTISGTISKTATPTPTVTIGSDPIDDEDSTIRQNSISFDLDGNSVSDLIAIDRKKASFYLLTEELSVKKIETANIPAYRYIGSGHTANDKHDSLVYLTQAKSSEGRKRSLQWNSYSLKDKKNIALAVFGDLLDIPVIGCEINNKLVPAVLKRKKSSHIFSYLRNGKRTVEIELSGKLVTAICTRQVSGRSNLVVLSREKNLYKISNYNLDTKARTDVPEVEKGIAARWFFVLPETKLLPARPGFVTVKNGRIFTTILSQEKEWVTEDFSFKIKGISGITSGATSLGTQILFILTKDATVYGLTFQDKELGHVNIGEPLVNRRDKIVGQSFN